MPDETSAPQGYIEPNKHFLTCPTDDCLLYKIMTVENLLRSFKYNYLHFNRVDMYSDFQNADLHDGKQLPKDQMVNKQSKFLYAPDFTLSDYYNQSRERTYACCFSRVDSKYLWETYGSGSTKGKVCIVFNFGKLRAAINQTFNSKNFHLLYNGIQLKQIFSVDYGIVEYVDRHNYQANTDSCPNPILYTYLKDDRFEAEKELRITLSASGMGKFILNNGQEVNFPGTRSLYFNYKVAFVDHTIQQILKPPDDDPDFLKTELNKLGFEASI